ncbi:MAG TPA: hypothetical protein VNF24_10015 [Candidatus Acidoferrales bacterium]|nr:hypothetical protein [Candidatus Acidoferrales bacterium]
MNQDRADGYGPLNGLIRELRIRWRLFRRGHSLGHRHVVLLIVTVAGFWIALGLYHGLRTDAGLRRQLTQLQGQSQSLSGQVQAQRLELLTAASSLAQAELARSQGLSPSTDQVYAVENPVQAAGPVAIQQGAVEVGQTAQSLVQSLLGVTPKTS